MSGGKGKKQTVGYRYLFDIHMGLSRGPVDEIVEVRVGDLKANDGSVPLDGSAYPINKPNLFGGDEREGGIVGTLQMFSGLANQIVPADIKAKLGGLVSDWRGVLTAFYSGVVATNNPYPKQWAFRVRRALEGWDGPVWYPAKARISMAGGQIIGMNPAHILYECLTNREWGRGLPRNSVDDVSFSDAANTLCGEGFGLCLKWSRKDDLDEFVRSVINHISGALYVNRSTGLWTLRLIRADYEPANLPVFSYDSGLLDIEDDESGTSDNTINEMIVEYFDPLTKSMREVRAQDSAAFATQGSIRSETQRYPGVPTGDLAARLAERDLAAQSIQLRRFKLKCDRRAWNVAPADVFRINVPSRGIGNLIVRVGKIDDTVMGDGTITLYVSQDVYSLPSTSYISIVDPIWQPPPREALPVTVRQVSEASYFDLVGFLPSADLAQVQEGDGYIITQGQQPGGTAMDYVVYSGISPDLAENDIGIFTPTATVTAATPALATQVLLTSPPAASVVEGASFARIVSTAGDEIVSVGAYNANTGVLTIGRGCADTIPKAHTGGARVWFYGEGAGSDGRDYANGEIVSVKLLTRTPGDQLSENVAPQDNITITARQSRPYPPGAFTINGEPFTAPPEAAFPYEFAWAHRDRILQADQIVTHGETSVGPEAGVTYTMRFYNAGTNALLQTISGITGTSQMWTAADHIAVGSPDAVFVELESVRGSYVSRDRYRVRVQCVATGGGGFNLDFNNSFNG